VEEYERLTGGQKSVADLLAMPSAAEVEFEPPRLTFLDTNVVSELRNAKKADQNVRKWAHFLPAGKLYISVIQYWN